MKLILIQCIIFILAFSITGETRSGGSAKVLASAKSISGINIITDPNLKKDLIKYITLHEKFDYMQLYSYLSKEYLKKYFPDVNNEKEYNDYKNNNSEIGYLKYLKILECEKIDSGHYTVTLLIESESEGFGVTTKNKYYIIFEDNKWKFNGHEILEYLEEKELQSDPW